MHISVVSTLAAVDFVSLEIINGVQRLLFPFEDDKKDKKDPSTDILNTDTLFNIIVWSRMAPHESSSPTETSSASSTIALFSCLTKGFLAFSDSRRHWIADLLSTSRDINDHPLDLLFFRAGQERKARTGRRAKMLSQALCCLFLHSLYETQEIAYVAFNAARIASLSSQSGLEFFNFILNHVNYALDVPTQVEKNKGSL
nr:hypothetical protein Iba_chr11bCG3000 [Ipomoea batatas]